MLLRNEVRMQYKSIKNTIKNLMPDPLYFCSPHGIKNSALIPILNCLRKERILILWAKYKKTVMHICLLQSHHKNHSNSITEEEKVPISVHMEK
jgi:hypothetical protein